MNTPCLSSARVAAALAIAAVFAFTATGCGSDDDSSSSANSKSVFIKEAGDACEGPREGTFKKIETFQRAHRSDDLPKEVLADKALTAALLSTITVEIAALQRLEAPAGDEGEVEAILASLQAGLDEAKEGRKTPASVKAPTPALRVGTYFDTADKELRAYGLARCVKGP